MDSEYASIGVWFGVPVFLIVWIGCVIHAAGQFGWFLGIPAGLIIGFFFAYVSALIAVALWPLIAISVVLLILLITGAL